ncbi:MAG: sodium:solute symporter [Myxococcales bacterium]|nr:sodium:solute symporter [Myxococcales bacterium]
MTELLATTLGLYVIATYALGWWSRGRIQSAEDFLVAGRRLPLGLAWATLLATWFGAGTMLTAADAIHADGLVRAALEPLGSGVCLLLAGFLLAERLWSMRLLTLADFYARRFGRRAEVLGALLMVPSFLGWIAVQFIALAGMLEAFFGLDPALGIPLVAALGTGYTLLGGMWSVALTDALQLALLLVGLVVLGIATLAHLGDGEALVGLARIAAESPPGHLDLLPREGLEAIVSWLGVFAIAAIGNLPGQDLLSRIFAARSAIVARRACLLAGLAYLAFGAIPALLGLAAGVVLGPGETTSVLPLLAKSMLSPTVAVVFTLALTSAVFSTVDSAILAPAGVLAQNLLAPRLPRVPALTLNRIAVLVVAAAAVVIAFLGESAYSLLEDAYAIGLVALVVPLFGGLWGRARGERPALAAMLVGAGIWLGHLALGWESFGGPGLGNPRPRELAAAGLALLAVVIAGERGPGAGPEGRG